METAPKDSELNQLKSVIGETIDISQQKKLLEAFSKEKREKDRARSTLSQSQEHPVSNRQSVQAGIHGLQKQESWYSSNQQASYINIPRHPDPGQIDYIRDHKVKVGAQDSQKRSSWPSPIPARRNAYFYEPVALYNTGDKGSKYDIRQQSQPAHVAVDLQHEQAAQLPYNSHSVFPDQHIYSQHQQEGYSQHIAQQSAVAHAATHSFRVGDRVQLAGRQCYGVVRWIGTTAFMPGQIAGIELDDYMDGCTDGTHMGEKYFDCPPGKAIFCRLNELLPDERLNNVPITSGNASIENPLQVPLEEQVDQYIEDASKQMLKYLGDKKGIQGHQNSCYLDSTVFGLFALSDVFDTMFLEADKTADKNRIAISSLLWKGIVNPLRKNGVVRYESVLKLRNKLDELGMMEGVTEKDKDPEEFLNMLFKHMLQVPPFLSIRRPFGVEQEFFVQLFVEFDANLRLPTVGDSLKQMFKDQQISFTMAPSRLLIQVPRFERDFKSYMKTVPDLTINIAELTDSYTQAQLPECVICGERSLLKCTECKNDFQSIGGDVYFCDICSSRAHIKEGKKDHRPQCAVDTKFFDLDLLSVICIETSHYVCFTRDPNSNSWIFFDSMEKRLYDKYYIPKVTDCTHTLNDWVYPPNSDRTRLMSTQSWQLPELVRRFTQDAYMCVYIQPDVAMYGDNEDFGAHSDYELLAVSSSPQPNLDTRSVSHSQPSKAPSNALLEMERIKQENASLLAGNTILSLAQEENEQEITALRQEKLEVVAVNEKLQADLRQKNQELYAEKQEKQQAQQRFHLLEGENQQRQDLIEDQRQQLQDLQRKLEEANAQVKVYTPLQDQESLYAQRQEVVIREELGAGAWGSVYKGKFRGQRVAVKQAHRQILHENTIDQLKREIRIMAHVQHPNLVRLIAAVVDDKVEQCTDTPLLILELLSINLRKAYKKKDLKDNVLVSIFRDVAYALHYLHEHQEPIIHRDVSAPNVLLEEVHRGIWRAKLSDFGSANLVKQCKTAAAGALIYSAPETFPPRNPYDPLPKQTTKIDVFSYGYLLAEVISKEMPAAERRKDILTKVERQWKPMYDLIMVCIRDNPDDRLTMTQVLEKLNVQPRQ